MENQFILAPGVTGEVGGMPTGPPQRGLTVNVRNYTSRNFSEGFCYMQNGPSGEFNLVNVPVSKRLLFSPPVALGWRVLCVSDSSVLRVDVSSIILVVSRKYCYYFYC